MRCQSESGKLGVRPSKVKAHAKDIAKAARHHIRDFKYGLRNDP
jgi:hypothetical protein